MPSGANDRNLLRNLRRRAWLKSRVKTRHYVAALATLVAAHADVQGLTPPSDSDGPIRLLNCVVAPGGELSAEVDNRSEDSMTCDIRCNYEFAGKTLSRWLEVRIPARHSGRVGRFDTSGGKPGNYSGELGNCRKTDARASIAVPRPDR